MTFYVYTVAYNTPGYQYTHTHAHTHTLTHARRFTYRHALIYPQQQNNIHKWNIHMYKHWKHCLHCLRYYYHSF